jgi:uncharacterized protein (TIGR02594 family)
MSNADRIAAALRPIAPGSKLLGVDVPLINQLGALWDARAPAANSQPNADPAWIAIGRNKIGQREITGPKHNSWISTGWARLGAKWFNDDETPWCGFFVADCLDAAGLPYPKEFPRAKSYATWGTACPAQLGAIGVKSRSGGGHVFFIVGETLDGKNYKVLEGNANNMVRIGDIPKSVVTDIRWPAGGPLPAPSARYLPRLPAGTISSSEA